MVNNSRRKISSSPTEAAQTQPFEFNNNWAVVIGINDYSHGIDRLTTARPDAKRLAEILEKKHDYTVDLIIEDVTKSRLTTLLEKTLSARISKNDRLLFYFAGHGEALNSEDDGPAGYLIPQDAILGDPNTYLPMQMIHNALTKLPCRHCLVILDCCFAGAFQWANTRRLSSPPNVLYRERYQRFLRSPAWQVLTSASYDQEALDVASSSHFGTRNEEGQNHSPFASALFDALTDEGEKSSDANNDGVLMATELYLYLLDNVEILAPDNAQNPQTPGLLPLIKRHDKGEFIFNLGEPKLKPAPELTVNNNPYRGLRSYNLKDANLFFGRSEEIKQLVQQVKTQPFTAVLGASGTGKSSLVKAGVVPKLLTQPRANAPDSPESMAWHSLNPIRPGEAPLDALAQELKELRDNKSTSVEPTSNSIQSVVDSWLNRNPNQVLLIVIDQFEELVTLCRDTEQRTKFQTVLKNLLNRHPDRFRLIITLRSDFESQFKDSPLFPWFMEESTKDDESQTEFSNRFVVPPMNQDDLREVIEGPANENTLFFDPPELVDELINEVVQMPGALPLLSFTLEQLCLKYIARQGATKISDVLIPRSLTKADYDDLGKVIGSLRTRADKEFNALSDDLHRTTMKRVMLRMVATEGEELARRRVPMTELIYPSDQENKRVKTVIERLVDARLLVQGSVDLDKDGTPDDFVEPAHDALMRAWHQLRNWKDEFGGSLNLQRTLTASANDWHKEGEKPNSGLLWQNNPNLQQLQAVLFPEEFSNGNQSTFMYMIRQYLWPPTVVSNEPTWLNRVETEFVQTSLVRRANVLKRIVSITTAVIIVLSGITIFALLQQQRANTNAQAAIAEADARATEVVQRTAAEAVANQRAQVNLAQAIVARSQSETDDDLALLLGVEAAYLNDEINAGLQAEIDDALRKRFQKSHFSKVLEGHVSATRSVTFSPDGKWLVTAEDDNTILIWSASNYERAPIRVASNTGTLTSLDIGFNSSILVAAGIEGIACWNISELSQPEQSIKAQVLNGTDISPRSVGISPDNSWIAVAGYTEDLDGVILVWPDCKSDAQPVKLIKANGWFQDLAFSPDGQWLAASNSRRKLYLWNIDDGIQSEPQIVNSSNVAALAFSPDSKWLVTGDESSTIDNKYNVQLWSVQPFTTTKTFNRASNVYGVAFSPDNETVVASGYEGNIWRVPAESWNTRYAQELSGHEDFISDVDFSPDGAWLASSSYDRTIRLWWTLDSNKEYRLASLEDSASTLDISGNGEWVAYAINRFDSTLILWSTNSSSDTEIIQLPRIPHEIREIKFFPQKLDILTIDSDGQLLFWMIEGALKNIEEDAFFLDVQPRVLEKHDSAINAIDVTRDGTTIALGNEDGTVHVGNLKHDFDAFSTEVIGKHEQSITSVAFAPTSDLLAASDRSGQISVWSLEGDVQRVSTEYQIGIQINSVAFSEEWFVAAADDGQVLIWPIRDLNSDHISINSFTLRAKWIGFSDTGEWLMAVGDNKTVRMWPTPFWDQQPITLPISVDEASMVEMSPDGYWIFTAANFDGVFGQLSPATLRHLACQAARRNFTFAEWETLNLGADYRRTCCEWPEPHDIPSASPVNLCLR